MYNYTIYIIIIHTISIWFWADAVFQNIAYSSFKCLHKLWKMLHIWCYEFIKLMILCHLILIYRKEWETNELKDTHKHTKQTTRLFWG